MKGVFNALAIVLLAIIIFSLGMCAGHGSKQTGTKSDTVYSQTVIRDTLVKLDTIKLATKPKIIRYTKYRIARDTIQVPGVELAIIDTLQGDSIMSRLTEIIKQDTTFKELTKDTVWITQKPEKAKWKPFSVNVSAGYGYSIGSPIPSPQIGITVGIKLFSF
jgi:hypothetical protein